jgi:hypothetical protein
MALVCMKTCNSRSRPLAKGNVLAAMAKVENCLGIQSSPENNVEDEEDAMRKLNRILLDKLTLFRQLGTSDMTAYLLQCELDPESLRLGSEVIGLEFPFSLFLLDLGGLEKFFVLLTMENLLQLKG